MKAYNKLIRFQDYIRTGNLLLQSDTRPAKDAPSAKKLLLASFFLVSLIILLLGNVACVVVYQVRFIAGKTGRMDYALAGETFELSCHYIMKDEAEDIKQLIWSKDGKNFLRWRKNKPGLDVLSYTFKGHIDPSSKYNHIIINNATIDMHGKYKCSIKTDLGTHDIEQNLIVISQTNCKLNDWRVISEPSQCRESFKLECKNMFPKPVPSCGLWNRRSDKFIRSVAVDISEEQNKDTYRVSYSDRFELRDSITPKATNKVLTAIGSNASVKNSDLFQYAGHLMFKCDIIVPETSWKLSLTHRMFDYGDGCEQDPLETIERMRLNYSQYATSRMQQAGYLTDRKLDDFEMLTSNLKYEISSSKLDNQVELNCWRKPKIGSLAKLTCADQTKNVKLIGANVLECRKEGWLPLGLLTDYQEASKPKALGRQARTGRPPEELTPPPTTSTQVDLRQESTAQPADSIDVDDNNNKESSNEIYEEQATTNNESPETIPNQAGAINQAPYFTPGYTYPSPAQLAALLPTCVSSRRHYQLSTVVSNRLPLLDEARMLESMEHNHHRGHNQHNRYSTQQDRQNQKSFFVFSTSGANWISNLSLEYIMLSMTLAFIATLRIH